MWLPQRPECCDPAAPGGATGIDVTVKEGHSRPFTCSSGTIKPPFRSSAAADKAQPAALSAAPPRSAPFPALSLAARPASFLQRTTPCSRPRAFAPAASSAWDAPSPYLAHQASCSSAFSSAAALSTSPLGRLQAPVPSTPSPALLFLLSLVLTALQQRLRDILIYPYLPRFSSRPWPAVSTRLGSSAGLFTRLPRRLHRVWHRVNPISTGGTSERSPDPSLPCGGGGRFHCTFELLWLKLRAPGSPGRELVSGRALRPSSVFVWGPNSEQNTQMFALRVRLWSLHPECM